MSSGGVLSPVSPASEDKKERPSPVESKTCLARYFKFVRDKNEKNVIYQCLACLPKVKELSVNRRSYNNLKVHYRSAHANSYDALLEHLESVRLPRSNISVQVPISLVPYPSMFEDEKELRSAVDSWPRLAQYFQFLREKDDKNMIYQCLACLPKVKELSVNRKSYHNLKVHYRSAHGIIGTSSSILREYLENTKMLVDKIPAPTNYNKRHLTETENAFAGLPTKKLCVDQSEKFLQSNYEQLLLRFLVANMIPPDVVDTDSFRELMKYCAPYAKDVSSKTLTCCIEDGLSEKRNELKLALKDVPYVATTANAWKCRNRSYLGMTVHWIERDSLRRRKAVLACRRLKGYHKFDLVNLIQKIHAEFDIDGKVCMMTTDFGSDIVKSFSTFGSDQGPGLTNAAVSSNELADDVEVKPLTDILQQDDNSDKNLDLPIHSRCAVHTFDLIATVDANQALSCETFKRISGSAFAKVHQLWNKQSSNPQAADSIIDELGDLLVVPTQTCWKSVYDAVSRLISVLNDREKRAALNQICSSLDLPAFSNADVLFLAEYIKVMKPLCLSLDRLKCEERGHYGLLLPTVAVCAKRLTDINEVGDLSVCEPLLSAVLDGLKIRFKPFFHRMDCLLAASFHPHFKFSWLPLLPLLGIEDVDSVRAKLCLRMVHDLNNVIEACNPRLCSEDDFFGSVFAKEPRKDNNSEMLLDEYLKRGYESHRNELHTLLPNEFFRQLFVRYNTAIPSGAERLFSAGTDVFKLIRAGLSDEHFEMSFLCSEKQGWNNSSCVF